MNKYSLNIKIAVSLLLSFFLLNSSQAKYSNVAPGKPVYCDTSAGRTVLNNGSYSKSYCRYTAIMNRQKLHGCCTWAGGVMIVSNGNVICRNGTSSAVCSLQNHEDNSYMKSDGTVTLNNDQW